MKNGTRMTLVERMILRLFDQLRAQYRFFILLRRINLWKSVQVCLIFNNNALLSYQTKKNL